MFLAGTTQAYAGDKPLYAPIPAWVKPAPTPTPSKNGGNAPVYQILDAQHDIADGQITYYTEQVVRMATAQILAQFGTIQLPWHPDHGDLTIHKLKILRDGEVIDLLAGGKQFDVIRREQKLEQQWVDGILTATLQAEGLRVGDRVRLVQSVTRKDKSLGGHVQGSNTLFAKPLKLDFGRFDEALAGLEAALEINQPLPKRCLCAELP